MTLIGVKIGVPYRSTGGAGGAVPPTGNPYLPFASGNIKTYLNVSYEIISTGGIEEAVGFLYTLKL